MGGMGCDRLLAGFGALISVNILANLLFTFFIDGRRAPTRHNGR
jgi:hypothetical protein